MKRILLTGMPGTGYCPGRLEKLLDFYSHPGYIAHKVHLMVAYDLERNPLDSAVCSPIFSRYA